jgi:pyridoxal phosphate enzyme (YggS family)
VGNYNWLKESLANVKERIAQAAGRSGRSLNEITLVAVSKTHPAEIIRAAAEYGVSDIGESRVQEAEPKIKLVGNIVRWHMVGHLQTNKARKAVSLFDMIQSVDSLKLAGEIDRRAGQTGKKMECLIEVNSSGEATKSGVPPDEGLGFIEEVSRMGNISLRGVMTIGPFVEEEQTIREAFRKTRELFQEGQEAVGEPFSILSMGMTDDFEIAIEEGSNMVRIGTAIFGPRERP